MLFVESRVADRFVEKDSRLALLEALAERGHEPLLRASRLHLFEQALAGAEHARELERLVAEASDAEGEVPYVRGDVFCAEGYSHFVVFGDEEAGGLRAGVAYGADTPDAAEKLEEFCRAVEGAVRAAARGAGAEGEVDGTAAEAARIEWRARGGSAREALMRFASAGGGDDSPSVSTPRGVTAERLRAGELLEDEQARTLLHRLSEAQADGRLSEMLAPGARGAGRDELVARLAGAGLVKREILVSCRRDGHSLFRLPSSDALAIVTASNAVCSECGTAIADERAEETVTPTPLADSMLKDGAWMVNSLRATLRELGLAGGDVAARPHEEGGARMFANVCGEPFMFVLRDGDFTGAHARRALEGEAESHATRLVVVATGSVQDEARSRLREHARRRSRAGAEAEVIFVEGLSNAHAELRRAVERVSQEALARELYELDASAGFSVGRMLAARQRLAQRRGALEDLAASAAGALSGSLREF
ncbi:MAG TPA: hypothetical protein VD968_13205 [Pyrinomonadaceae bacterium]|nr:hypothetical protein [Pyrinomonadaceae bacterium]